MHARVDDEAAGPHRVGRQHAHPVERARVEAHLVGQPLRVETPALAIGGDEGAPAELRDRFELAGDRQLEMMARNALVVGGRFDVVAAPTGRIGRVHEEDPAAAAVLGRRKVEGDRPARRRLNVAIGLRHDPEPAAHRRPRLGHRGLRRGDDLRSIGVVETRIRAQRLEDPVEIGRPDDLRAECPVLGRQRFDLPKTDFMDLLGRQRHGRVEADQPLVGFAAIGQPGQPAPLIRPSLRQDVVAEGVAVSRQGRPDLARDRLTEAPLPGLAVRHALRLGGGEERILGDRHRQPGVELVDRIADGEIGRCPVVSDAVAVTVREVAEVRRDAIELADHRLCDLSCWQGQFRDPDGEHRLRPKDRIGREFLETARQDVGPDGRVPGDHLAGDPLVRPEAVDGDRLCLGCEVALGGNVEVFGRPPDLLELTGETVIALKMCPGRVGSEAELVVALGQRVDVVGHGDLRAGSMRSVEWRHGSGHAREERGVARATSAASGSPGPQRVGRRDHGGSVRRWSSPQPGKPGAIPSAACGGSSAPRRWRTSIAASRLRQNQSCSSPVIRTQRRAKSRSVVFSSANSSSVTAGLDLERAAVTGATGTDGAMPMQEAERGFPRAVSGLVAKRPGARRRYAPVMLLQPHSTALKPDPDGKWG